MPASLAGGFEEDDEHATEAADTPTTRTTDEATMNRDSMRAPFGKERGRLRRSGARCNSG